MLHIEVEGPVVVQRTGDIGAGCCFTIPPTSISCSTRSTLPATHGVELRELLHPLALTELRPLSQTEGRKGRDRVPFRPRATRVDKHTRAKE